MRGLRNIGVFQFLGFVVTAAIAAHLLVKWSAQPGSVELRQGQRIVYQIMGEETLREVGFYKAYPQGRPSDFVRFADSHQARRLWPQSVSEFNDSDQKLAKPDPGRVLRPDDLSFSAHEPDSTRGKQIVYIPHDEEGQIEVRGYETPDAEPVFTYEWDFPTDAGKIPL